MEPEEYRSIYRLEATHWWYQGMRAISESLIRRHVPSRRRLRILDAGCGTGGMMMVLARYGEVSGIDYSPLALAFCRKRHLSRIACASVTHLPFRDATFDLATSFEVLYHAAVADDLAALRELRRVLRPGGLLLLRLPAFEFLRGSHDVTVHTRHRYTASELRRKLRSAGFGVERITYVNTLLFPIAAGTRVAQRIAGSAERAESDVRQTSPMVNALLRLPLLAEAGLLRIMDLPIGLSVLALARRPA